MGLFEEIDLTAVDLLLQPGDVLVLYTDGVTEAATAEGRFGESGLARVLAGSDASEPQTTVDDIEAAVLAARLAGTADDLALLAIGAA
jgi:serine phosphatase RsbU (regulator of sigma subunit)